MLDEGLFISVERQTDRDIMTTIIKIPSVVFRGDVINRCKVTEVNEVLTVTLKQIVPDTSVWPTSPSFRGTCVPTVL